MDNDSPSQEKNSANKHVKITLVDTEGNQIEYRVKRHIPLGKIAELYCNKYNKEANSLRMSWLGNQVQKSATPESLNMPDEAEIEITVPQDGGFK